MLKNFIYCSTQLKTVVDMGKKPVTTYLDEQDQAKLDDLSRETGRPISVIVREAVKRYLKQERM